MLAALFGRFRSYKYSRALNHVVHANALLGVNLDSELSPVLSGAKRTVEL